jgi:predicted NBD/HSP70 family sugar kinase
VNGETCGNTGCCQQTCGPPPIERERGEVRHIGSGRELKEQDDKDKLCQGAPALLHAS